MQAMCNSSASAPQRSSGRGFTAVELIVTVAVLAILAALAAPSFNPLIERYRTRQVAEDLLGSFYLARSEAIKRGGGVDIVARSNDWAQGWAVKAGATDLQLAPAPANVTVTTVGGTNTVSADRWGMLESGTSKSFYFQIEPTGGNVANSSTLCVKPGGLITRENGKTHCS